MPNRVYSNRRWRRIRATVLAQEAACHLCGGVVDKTLPSAHPLSAAVDHLVPLSKGGDPFSRTNAALTHKSCNSRKGGGRGAPPTATIKRSGGFL